MKKSLIALAVAGAFAAPAFAATSNIDISGKIAADVTFVDGLDTTQDAMQVNNNNSVITVAGNEDLGGGLKAFFSVSYGLPLANAGTLSGQNQIAGLEGGFGKVFVGAFDNPLKVMGRGTDLFADQSTGDARYLTAVGLVEARANDVIAYISPSVSGLQGVLAYSQNPTLTVSNDSTNANPSMYILKVSYANGPLSVAAGYHKVDYTNEETAWRVTGSYKMGDLKMVGSYQDVSDAGGISGKDISTWGVGGAYAMGPMTVKAQYYSLSNDQTANADADMWAIGLDYALSKRTTAQLAYSKVTNESAAAYGGTTAVVAGSDALTVGNGKDPSRLSIGMKQTF